MAVNENSTIPLSSWQLVKGILKCRCPRCGQGKMFKYSNPYRVNKMLATYSECSYCHLNFNPEPGFYWGATYTSYALGVAFSGFNFIISTLVFGFMNSLSFTYVIVNGALLILVSPLFFRFSRSLWLFLFYERG